MGRLLPVPSSTSGASGHNITVPRLLIAVILSIVSLGAATPIQAQSDALLVQVKINKMATFDLSSELQDGEQFIGIDQATGGVGSIDSGGSGTYMPNANFVGSESLYAWAKGAAGPARAISITFETTGDLTGTEARGDFVETDEDLAITLYPLANDAAGPGGGGLTIVLESEPLNGTAAVQVDGSIVYTPDPNWHGSEEFWYSSSDGLTSKSAPIGIDVMSVRDLPTATADALVIRQGEQASIDVLVNDSDGDGDSIWVAGSTPPAYGTATWSDGDRMFWYQPIPDFHGVDQFTYLLADADGQSTGTVSVTVDGAPIAVDDAIQIEIGGSVTFDPLANDTDPEGSLLAIESVSKPVHGKTSIKPDGTVSYRAGSADATEDSFTYTIRDAIGNSSTGTVRVIRIAKAAETIHASDDEFLVLEDSAGNTLDLLGNDSVPDGSAVALTITSSPSFGTLVVDAMQLVTYIPDPEYSGADSFAYRISGPTGASDAAVSVTVQVQNDLPIAAADSAITDEDVPVVIDVLANDSDIDGDDLVVESVVDGLLGKATVSENQSVIYTPNPDVSGTDLVSYVVSDGFGGTAMMSMSITINPIADPPHVADDSVQIDRGEAIEIDVLANDRDPDGDPLNSLTIVEEPRHGTVSVLPSGKIGYQPEKRFEGKDSFTYSVADPSGNLSIGRVRIQVGEPNAKPETTPDDAATTAGQAILIDVLENDDDPDGDDLELFRVSKAKHGTVEIRGDKIHYEPNPGFAGTDTFTYRVTDGSETDTGRVTVVVSAPED